MIHLVDNLIEALEPHRGKNVLVAVGGVGGRLAIVEVTDEYSQRQTPGTEVLILAGNPFSDIQKHEER